MPETRSPVGPAPTAPLRAVTTKDDEEEIDLGEMLGILYDGRWLIAAAVALALFGGLLYAVSATRIYRADALVQVEEKSGITDPFKELSSMFSGKTAAEAELEILRSRSVVSTVVEQLHLDIVIRPRRAPLVGSFFARRHKQDGVAAPKLWMSAFAWGGERLAFEHLEVPPHHNGKLTLVAQGDGAYQLLDGDNVVLQGKTGERVSAGGFAAQVRALEARPGTEFSVTRLPFAEAVNRFQDDLVIREKGKDTGVIQLVLEGEDGELIREALDAVTRAYVRQNVKRKEEETERTLEFVQAQLPLLKRNLDEAELRLKQYRAEAGNVDVSLEAEALIESAAELEKQATALELQKTELVQRYTGSHPALVAMRQKQAALQRERKMLEDRARALPEAELNSVRLMRDAKVANELYILLLTKGQELGVIKSGTVGNVRVVDAAVTQPRAVSPNAKLVVALSLLAGLVGGAGLAFLRKSLNRGVDDPEVLEKTIGISVYAAVPFSARHEQMVAADLRNKEQLRPLATVDPADLAIESLRSLRTSLQFSLAAARTRVVMIGGSRPGVGKSFISMNLAHVMADAGKKVLLIDADLRRGQLHRYLGRKRPTGLSEVIMGGALEEHVRQMEHQNLFFLASGAVPPNPSELLSSERFAEVIAQAEATYDLVMIDTPPILAVTDAAVISRVSGVNLMVVRSGLHPLREISVAVARMEQSGARPTGFVFNGVDVSGRSARYGKKTFHYQYDYR